MGATMVAADVPVCCGKPCWDNRESKRNPNAPDFKCKTDPEHVVWSPRGGKKGTDKRPEGSPPLPWANGAAPSAPAPNAKQAHSIGAPIPGLDVPTPDAAVELYRPYIKAAVRLLREEVDAAGVVVTADAVHACSYTLYRMANPERR